MSLRYFLDTEFIEAPYYLDPISIAIVCEDGREFYAVNAECDFAKADPWVVQNVLSKLPSRESPLWMSRRVIAIALRQFIEAGGDTPEFWAYFADYDWVLFCWLLGGRMIDMPKGWPMFCLDLKQAMVERGLSREDLPPKPADAHDALVDARWLRSAWARVHAPRQSGGGKTR